MSAETPAFVPGVHRVVVGFDGSDCSVLALEWALAEAQRWEAPLLVVRTWEFTPLLAATGAPTDLDEIAARVAEHVREEVLEAIGVDLGADGAADVGGAAVRLEVVEGSPAKVLTEAAAPGDLLVLGSRGLGGFKELMLGSVSRQVSLHARCPVVIIREP